MYRNIQYGLLFFLFAFPLLDFLPGNFFVPIATTYV